MTRDLWVVYEGSRVLSIHLTAEEAVTVAAGRSVRIACVETGDPLASALVAWEEGRDS